MLIEKTKRYKTKVKRTRVAGRFKKKTQAIQELVERDLGDLSPPKRADGTISLDGDWLSENAPSDHDSLQCLIQHDKLQKILSVYLDLYAQTDAVYPRINTLGPRSGRRSASGPNIQNIPKRKWGIRGLFVPRPDHYFVRCNYTAQELFTLCQAMIDLGIERGPLWECITSDRDPHIVGATKTLGKPYEEVTKEERTGQKVVGFGVPGGLGAKSLRDYAYATFGVRWTLKEAKQARAAFLKAFPDIVAFLDKLRPGVDILQEQTGMSEFDWKMWLNANDIYAWNTVKALCEHPDPATRLMGEAAARAVPITMTSGRVRGGAKFTEAANSHFQGRGADVTKHAEWLCFKKFGRPPTIVCHDEIVMEFPLLESGDTEAHDKLIKKDSVERLMKQAFIDMCPDVGPYARVEGEILTKWGKSTDKDGKEIE